MHTKYLGLAAMTVLLGAQAIAIPRPFEQTNDKAMKRSLATIKAPADDRDRMLGRLPPKDALKGLEKEVYQGGNIKVPFKHTPHDIKNKNAKKYKPLIAPIADAIVKGDQDAIQTKIKLALPLIKSSIPRKDLEAKLKELVALLPKDLPKKEIEARLMKAVELLSQKGPKNGAVKGLDGLKSDFQKGVNATESKIEYKKGGEKKPDLYQADGLKPVKIY
ncbi:hypothetical protein DM02DRAFT_660372 [Periconia macrospinosa]|uniref:Uncharacterized protein n=1 Tax=Periconia macrospinosa TaxID=97972 RepID=A0A2V1DAV6_9PLEO|nr:hypothetical protein DM02DRAFT_660372 [Periconia macrospinosa]